MTEFTLGVLLPDFTALTDEKLVTPEGITAFFVLLICIFFFTYVLWTFYVFIGARSRYRFYLRLIKGIQQKELASKRRTLKQKASEREKKKKWAELWNEFDETLTEVNGRIYNTVEAANFFNSSSLARRLAGSRLLAAGPGVLTGVGVLGTFLGLSLGLTHLTFSGGTDQMTSEIRDLVASASIAFTTSVWGVLSSLIYNIIEKWFEGHTLKRISDLQRAIDELFDRFSVADIFIDLRSDTHESRITLQGLAEQIGHKMQVAMSQATNSIQTGIETGLKNVLTPAVDRLVDAAEELSNKEAKGSEEALRRLMEKYIAAVSEQGDSHRHALNEASGEVRSALADFATNMNHFFSTLETQQEQLKADQDERRRLLEDSVKSASDQQRQAIDYVQKFVGDQVAATQGILEQGQSIGENVKQTNLEMNKATDKYRKASDDLLATANFLKEAAAGLGATVKSASDQISTSANAAASMMRETSNLTENLNRTMGILGEIKESIRETAHVLQASAETANIGYATVSEHYENLQKSMERHISDLEDEISKLLRNYADQVQGQTIERMSEWNKQTSEFSQSMVDAVEAIGAIVEEIDMQANRN
jgi:hypothetical protein